MHVARILEVLLFAAHGPVPIPTLLDVLEVSEDRLQQAVDTLRAHYEAHGIRVRQSDEGFYLDVATRYRKWASKLHDLGITAGFDDEDWDDETLNSIPDMQAPDLTGIAWDDESTASQPVGTAKAPEPKTVEALLPAATKAPAEAPSAALPPAKVPSVDDLRRAVDEALERAARLAKSVSKGE